MNKGKETFYDQLRASGGVDHESVKDRKQKHPAGNSAAYGRGDTGGMDRDTNSSPAADRKGLEVYAGGGTVLPVALGHGEDDPPGE